jgi:septal ring factor EnvC (AmiA/AmiB activator)
VSHGGVTLATRAIALLPLVLGGGLARAETPRSVLRELQDLDRRLVEAEEELLTTQKQQSDLERELAGITAGVASARVRQAEAMARYQQRLRALARMPTGARLVLLGGARTLADYLHATRVLRFIAKHDQALQQDYLQRLQELDRLEADLKQRREQQARLVALLRTRRDSVAADRQSRLSLVESLRRDRSLGELTVREESAAKQELGDTIDRLPPAHRSSASESFAQNRGKLPWPATGRVDVRFGQQVERAWGSVTAHNGIDIRAAAAAPVRAVAAGRVVFADWLKGYGQLVIIDHGEHFHSLVAHLAKTAVRAGDEVSAGQQIGTVGDTGSTRGTVLYFEIRDHGRPVDPSAWLRRP